MIKIKKGIVLALALLVMTGCKKEEKSVSEKPVVKIGVMLPLSGDISMFGKGVKTAIEKGFEDSEKSLEYNLIFEDTQFKPKNINMIANKFTSVDDVDAVISMWSIAANVVRDIFNKNDLTHLTCSWGSKVAKGKYNFNSYSSIEDEYKILIKYLRLENVKRLGIVMFNGHGPIEISDYIKANAKKDDFEVVSSNIINNGEKDFRILLSDLESQNLDMLLLLVNPPEIGILGKQIKEVDFNVPLTSIDTITGFEKMFEGSSYIASIDGSNTEAGKLVKGKGELVHPCVINHYISTKLLIKTYEELYAELNRKPSNKEVSDRLLNTENYMSEIGEINITKEGVISSIPQILKIIEGGKTVIVE